MRDYWMPIHKWQFVDWLCWKNPHWKRWKLKRMRLNQLREIYKKIRNKEGKNV